ncbi:hypothetical protein [Photobacterium damselae]|uniref:Uncharacterized protein n=1 Tax=Photobacterium damselae TaxID=38293 RepID=A0ACD3T349_PHODM|nr:hypothetical protein [Photobacterium damselae]TMX78097.1 hypothetical protein DA092_03105 [Photobacterium damselae]
MTNNMKAQSVINLYTEMQNALNERSDKYTWITDKCNRQSELASIARKRKKIEGMALGSFKKYCNKYIDGGFEAVDNLRKSILKEYTSMDIEEVNPEKPVNKLEEALREVESLRRDQAILVKAYNELNTIALDLIANSRGNSLEYQKHQDLFSSYFGLQLAVDNEK